MKVTLEGFYRNCGQRLNYERKIRQDNVQEGGIHWHDLAVNPIMPDVLQPRGVKILFAVSAQLKGDYLAVITFTEGELWTMLEACYPVVEPRPLIGTAMIDDVPV